MNPLNISPGRGHSRHLSTPGLGSEPLLTSPLSSGHALSSLGGGLSPRGYGHNRSRSTGGGNATDAEMAAEAARLGIGSPYMSGGLGGRSPYLGNGLGSPGRMGGGGGMSPRGQYFQSPREEYGGDKYDLGLGGGSRSRRGSLNGGGGMDAYGREDYGLGGGGNDAYGLGGGQDMDDYGLNASGSSGYNYGGDGRARRDSMPFEEQPLFDTRGY